MSSEPFVHIVGMDCPPELEDKFNRWYENTHIPMIFKFKGMKKATRYRISREGQGYPKYLAIYEFEDRDAFEAYEASPEMAAAMEETGQSWPGKKYERKWRVQYEPIKTWEK